MGNSIYSVLFFDLQCRSQNVVEDQAGTEVSRITDMRSSMEFLALAVLIRQQPE